MLNFTITYLVIGALWAAFAFLVLPGNAAKAGAYQIVRQAIGWPYYIYRILAPREWGGF